MLYQISKDYKALYAMLKSGGDAVISYGEVLYGDNRLVARKWEKWADGYMTDAGFDVFRDTCHRLKVEWFAPSEAGNSNPRLTVEEAMKVVERWDIDTLYWDDNAKAKQELRDRLTKAAKVHSLAAHPHAIAVELSGEQPAPSGNTTNDPQGRYYDDAHL